jgi:hypothetical protein
MAYYRVYLLNAADHIFFGKGIERGSDAAAITAAVAIANAAKSRQQNAIEIWAGTRRVAHLYYRGIHEWPAASYCDVARADVAPQSIRQAAQGRAATGAAWRPQKKARTRMGVRA